jgi:hypothetical protein
LRIRQTAIAASSKTTPVRIAVLVIEMSVGPVG